MALAPTAAALCLCCFLMTLDVREDCSRTSGVGSGLEPEPFADQLAGDVSRHDIGAVPDQRTRPRDRNLVGLVIDLVLHRRFGALTVPTDPRLEGSSGRVPDVTRSVAVT